MRNMCRFILGLFLGFGCLAGAASAQFKNGGQASDLKLPTISQAAGVTQRIGLTDITITYHRPLVGGRKIWGQAVPFGQVWRAGANENTTITFTDDVSVEGHPLPAGPYGLYMSPTADEWTVIFSKNSSAWGSFSYDQKEDALRVTVKPQPSDFREALTYDFDDVKPDSTVATLRWEKLAVPFRISVDVKATTLRSIHDQLRGLKGFGWEAQDEAARWCLDNNYNLEQALQWTDRSIQSEERFDNLLTKSEILSALGRKQEAEAAKAKAFDKASGIQLHFYGRGLQFQSRQEDAFAIFKVNAQKHPNEWFAHTELARMAVAQGNFDTAVKEMRMALGGAPDFAKPQIQRLIDRLEKKEHINP